MGEGTILVMRYRRNAQLLASDAAELLREQGIPVIPQALDVGDIDAEAIRLGDSVELAELPDGTFMVSVNVGDGDWKLEGVEYSLEDAVTLASSCYEMAANPSQGLTPGPAYKLSRGDRWASSRERDWEPVQVSETLARGSRGFGRHVGQRVLAEDDCEVFLVAGRYYAQARDMTPNARERPQPARVVVRKIGTRWEAKMYDSAGYLRSAVHGSDMRVGNKYVTGKQYVEEKIREFWPDLPVEYEGMTPNARELKTRMVGNCPVCEGDYRLSVGRREGRMVHHGYKRPGDGEGIIGDCWGVHHLAYELSTEGCEHYRDAQIRSREDTIEYLKQLEHGEITQLLVERFLSRGYGSKKELVRITAEDPDFEQAMKTRIFKTKREISERGSEIERMEQRIATWVPKPVRTFEEYEAAQRAAPERLRAQAEREAKRTAKTEKARIQAEKQERWEAEKRALMDRYREIFATCSKGDAVRHWREMYRAMNKKSYLHFYDKWLGIDDRLIELGLARYENGHLIYAYPDGSLRQ